MIGRVSKINTSGVQEITVNGVTYSANVIVENNDLVLDGEKNTRSPNGKNGTGGLLIIYSNVNINNGKKLVKVSKDIILEVHLVVAV